MKYALLIYGDESIEPAEGSTESQAIMGEYYAFTHDVAQRGILSSGEALHPYTSATTVRVRDGERLITDGPFAETKEQLGGFYVVDCKDLDEAMALAANIPHARTGSVEVRPVRVFE